MQITSRPSVSPVAAVSPVTAQTPANAGQESFAQVLAQASGAAPADPGRSLKAGGLPPLFKYAADGVITGDEMRMELADARADYRQRLTAALAAQEIDTAVPLRLQTDTAGHVRVVGDHPDKARVEALFAEDFGLQNAFKRMTSIARLNETVAETVAFQAAYRQDPRAAVAQYAHLFNTTTRLTVVHDWGSEGLDVLFSSERVFRSAWG